MLGKYQNMGKSKPYLIFGLTDETFSVVCNEKVPEGMPEEKTYLLLTFLDQCYWVLGTLIGAAAGSVITFNTEGLDFALTALFFIVIFTEQWMSQKKHGPAVAGVVCSGTVPEYFWSGCLYHTCDDCNPGRCECRL